MKWICSQIGAREHYAIPRALNASGSIDLFVTDFWCPPSSLLSTASISLRARYHSGLRDVDVLSFDLKSLWNERLRRKNYNQYLGFVEYGKYFSSQVRNILKRKYITSESIFFSYDTGFYEAGEYFKSNGGRCIVCQIDPSETEQEIVKAECELWPGWENFCKAPDVYNMRRRSEWEIADLVIVNSEWSKNSLVEQGVPSHKVSVIPLCYENNTINYKKKSRSPKNGETIRVLWLGNVIIRKGIQYLIESARMLEKENIRFDIVGPIGISHDVVKDAPKNMYFHGRCPRANVKSWYENSDIFVLPTLSDGFAITQIEAMAYGLPVIATKCCGQVVNNGENGFVIPDRHPLALANAINMLYRDQALREAFSIAALARSKQFGVDQLSQNLKKTENVLLTT